MSLQNNNPNVTPEQFRQYVKEYVSINREIAKLSEIQKELKNKKSNIENIIKGGMKKFNYEEINFKDNSSIKKTIRNKTQPINIKWVSQRISSLFPDKNETEIKEIADFICNIKYRKTDEVVESVKFQKPKVKKSKK
jgi:hypothetical protein